MTRANTGVDPRLETVIAAGNPRRVVDLIAVHYSALEPVALSRVRISDAELLGLSLCVGAGGVWRELQLDVDPGSGGDANVWIYGEGNVCGWPAGTASEGVPIRPRHVRGAHRSYR